MKTYGSMKLADVLAPAIRLAENGFPISKRLADEFERQRPALQRFGVSRRIFLNDGKMFQPGDTLRQPELAATLKPHRQERRRRVLLAAKPLTLLLMTCRGSAA